VGTFLQNTTRDSSKRYTKFRKASTIAISTHAPPSLPSWHKIQKQMKATLQPCRWRQPWYTLNYPSTMVRKK